MVLSDVLPYELPPSFNNRGLYEFIRASQVRLQGSTVKARITNADTEVLLRILLGQNASFPAGTKAGELVEVDLVRTPATIPTIPFQYTIRHRVNDFRTLTIPHPLAQLEMAEFYGRFESLILYHTSKSNFTLRRPARVAPYTVTGDWLFEERKSSHDAVEDDTREYEWLRSYFTYSRYSNVYKFYDSAEYRSCERRFGYLVRVDVAKCFDSIYTHSIAWAAHGHDYVKANLTSSTAVDDTFGGAFDRLMQRVNHSETSGITIGSETSRIFAEVILQAVDLQIESQLEEIGLIFGKDYEILRYVDDYFIFLANEQDRGRVLETVARSLRKYKLHLNAAKEEGEYTPWLSPLTVAKRHTVDLLRKTVKRRETAMPEGSLPRPYVDTAALIVGYKAILLDTGVSHFELANYALSRAERAAEKLIRSSQHRVRAPGDTERREIASHYRALTSALLGLLDFVFFAFSGAPRMSPAVKVARVTSSLLRLSREPRFPAHDRERIEMRIQDELMQQLRRSKGATSPDPVTATLIDCISDLGPSYAIEEDELAAFCGFQEDDGEFAPPATMNALLLFSIILHCRNHQAYPRLRKACEEWILGRMDLPSHHAERALVALNVLTCPFVSHRTRAAVLSSYGCTDRGAVARIAGPQTKWNIDWEGFDLYSALQRKRLYEVY
nr:antiviral reverse transcriptase Drt3b [Arthrobacter sp. ok909]